MDAVNVAFRAPAQPVHCSFGLSQPTLIFPRPTLTNDAFWFICFLIFYIFFLFHILLVFSADLFSFLLRRRIHPPLFLSFLFDFFSFLRLEIILAPSKLFGNRENSSWLITAANHIDIKSHISQIKSEPVISQ